MEECERIRSIDENAVSIFGGEQLVVLKKPLIRKDDNGLWARIIFDNCAALLLGVVSVSLINIFE